MTCTAEGHVWTMQDMIALVVLRVLLRDLMMQPSPKLL
jgi:hypothetical protein